MNTFFSLILMFQVCSVFPFNLKYDHLSNSYHKSWKANKIVGGTAVAGEDDYPFQVYFVAGGSKRICGGTIINKNHVITADHCLLGCEPNSFTFVIVGEHRVAFKDVFGSSAEKLFGSNFIRVKRFIKRDDGTDIAILQLVRDIQFTDRIQAACIPGRLSQNYAGWNAVVTGWGGTVGYNPGDGVRQKASDVLKETTLNVLNPYSDLCIKARGYGDHELCAYNEGHDSCQGDSGGPLTVNEDGKFVLIGVVSNGKGCGAVGHAGIYARVSYFAEWIKDNVGDVCTSDQPARPNIHQQTILWTNPPSPSTSRPNSSGSVKCGVCKEWDSSFCTPGEITVADSCSKCPIHKGWSYCDGDCKIKSQGKFRKCV